MTDRPGDAYLVRHQDWARGMFGARGGEPLFELAPELVAAIILENDRPETMALQHTFPWVVFATVAGVAAHVNQLQIINPSNSGLIVVVQGLKIYNKLSLGTIRITLDGALLVAGQAPNTSLDSRAKVVAAVPVVASLNAVDNATVGTNGVNIDQVTVAAGADGQSTVVPVRPAILTPGHRISIWNLTLNEASTFEGWGYERPLESTELVNR